MSRHANLFFSAMVCVAAFMAAAILLRPDVASVSQAAEDQTSEKANSEPEETVNDSAKAQPNGEKFPVVIRKPAGPPRVELTALDPQGRKATVACSTCHSARKPNFQNVSAETLDEFHKGMTFSHGKITCYACHNPENADTLRLADGTAVDYENVMDLCSQCHGPQATAFAHGAHGGMNGFWDLSRGPQTKNNCIDCHDPHVPKYPKMVVGFKPKDRFNAPHSDDHDHDHQQAEVE